VAAEALLEEDVTALLSWGTAGALHPELLPGSLLLPETVLSSRQTVFRTDASWRRRLVDRLGGDLDIYPDPLVESHAVVTTPQEKAVLREHCGASAVDMESASVARVARQARRPFMAIRAVCDPADRVLPAAALEAVDSRGRVRPVRLLRSLLRHPGELSHLIALTRDFRAALLTLSTVLRLTGAGLLSPQYTRNRPPSR
jgi:hopanoid-associated phosphorylase